MRQSVSIGRTRVPGELMTILYYIFSFIFLIFLFFVDGFSIRLFNLFTGSETVNCSKVLKLNLNPKIHLRLLFEFNELQTKVGTHFFS